MAATPIKATDCKPAFDLFDRHAGDPEPRYLQLRSRVETLTQQLAQARSEQQRERAEKEKLQRRLEEAGERTARLTGIGEMTARFAHQVRTPLASAMLYTAQLERSSARQRRVAGKIAARLNDLGRMVNDMLGFAAGVKRDEQVVSIAELLAAVQLSLDGQFDESIKLHFVTPDPDLRVSANPDALQGALLNLVTNAAQANDKTAVIVVSALQYGTTVEIAVADNGPGIEPEIVPRLFEPFFTTRPQGTGLGLAVVLAVAKAHGGEIAVETSKHGSCFSIRLPIQNATGEQHCG